MRKYTQTASNCSLARQPKLKLSPSNQIKLKMVKSAEKRIPQYIIQEKKKDWIKQQEQSNYQLFMGNIHRENRLDELPPTFQLIDLQKNNHNSIIRNYGKKNTIAINQKSSKNTLNPDKAKISSERKWSRVSLDFSHYEAFNFKILSQPISHLVDVSAIILTKYGMGDICGIYSLNKLVRQISSCYNAVAYHNFSHAFSLMHMMYHVFKMDKSLKASYTNQQIGFTLISALAHDLNHNGTNNGFQIKMKSNLAIIANNQSVLEKMHVKTFFQILKNKKINILDKTKNPQKMKQMIVKLILATDVSNHFKEIQKLKQMEKGKQTLTKANRYVIIFQGQFLLQQLFHACDIGNPCLDFAQYINWAALLSYQFNKQTELEQINDLEVTEMLKFKGLKPFYEGQIGFINFLVFPLWKSLSIFFPGLTPLTTAIQKNIEELSKRIKNLEIEKQ